MLVSAYDGTRTRIVSVDPAAGEISTIGSLSGLFAVDDHPPAGWLTGWRDSTPVALRLVTRELVTLPERQHALVGLTMSDQWLGTITAANGRSTIRLFPLSKSPAPVSMSTTR